MQLQKFTDLLTEILMKIAVVNSVFFLGGVPGIAIDTYEGFIIVLNLPHFYDGKC
jgi:hypothetical protein